MAMHAYIGLIINTFGFGNGYLH